MDNFDERSSTSSIQNVEDGIFTFDNIEGMIQQTQNSKKNNNQSFFNNQ